MIRSFPLTCLWMALWIGTPLSVTAQNFTLSLTWNGKRIEGGPIVWDAQTVRLLGRDGQLWQFAPEEAKDFKQVSDQFECFSAGELRWQLMEEFGKSYDVSGTGTYLVVHPVGQRAIWAQRFEDLYREMVHYFTARRFEISKPKCPLIAVVLPSQGEFLNYARKLGIGNLDADTKGLYHLQSNRILVFDQGDGHNPGNWETDYSVVIHEAAHQTAFNTGIHSRFGNTPVWVVEGIGTLFEAPGVYNARHHRQREDRINRYRFASFLQQLATRPENTLSHLISSDKLFEVDWRVAYANAWALTFYLTEREPAKYAEYLSKTAHHPSFTPYSSQARLKDFTDTFGTDLKMLDVRMVRFIESMQQDPNSP